MKLLLLIILLFFACAVAMTLLTRLLDSVRQIGDLRGQLTRNDATLHAHMEAMQQSQQLQEAQHARQLQEAQQIQGAPLDSSNVQAVATSKPLTDASGEK
jgi:predicted Holliday junction resolvase-like endonuclease